MLLKADIRKMLVDGTQWATWSGYQLPISERYVSIWAPRGTRKHWKPHRWKPDFFLSDYHSISYFWPGAWYTIHIDYHEGGIFAVAYCDIVLPTPPYTSSSIELIYTDLYIDVVVREDYSVFTKDHAVFERAAQHYPIVEESRQKAFEVLDWLEEHAKNWTGPFAVIPRHLPRTDWDSLTIGEIRESMLSALKDQDQDDTRATT